MNLNLFPFRFVIPGLVIFLTLILVFSQMIIVPCTFGLDEDQNAVNYSYFSEIGVGEYSTDDRTARAIQVPFSYQLRPMMEKQWGIKLLFPMTFGVVGIDAVDILGNLISLDAKVLSLTPGIEFQVPVRRNWVLKPFGKAGGAKDVSGGGEYAFIYSAGLKSSYTIPWKGFTFTLGNGIIFNGYDPSGEDQENYTSISIGLDTVYPLGFTLKGRETNIGSWVSYYYYLHDLEFERTKRPPLDIAQEYEIALTFGTYEEIPIWLFKFNRIGLAYRFSDELHSLRIIFEFPF